MKSRGRFFSSRYTFSLIAVGFLVLSPARAVGNSVSCNSDNFCTVKGKAYTGIHDGKRYSKGQLLTGFHGSQFFSEGVVFSGIHQGVYYSQGNKATGVHEGTYYRNGVPGSGTYEGKRYSSGKLLTGFYGSQFFSEGVVFSGIHQGVYYLKGNKGTGMHEGIYYRNGVPGSGTYEGKRYSSGKLLTGFHGTRYFREGVRFTGLHEGIYYSNGTKGSGVYEGIYYQNGVPGSGTYEGKRYSSGKLLTGFHGNRYFSEGLVFTGIHNELCYSNGRLFTGIYQGRTYKKGVLVFDPYPQITAVSKTSGYAGESISITGRNFSESTQFIFRPAGGAGDVILNCQARGDTGRDCSIPQLKTDEEVLAEIFAKSVEGQVSAAQPFSYLGVDEPQVNFLSAPTKIASETLNIKISYSRVVKQIGFSYSNSCDNANWQEPSEDKILFIPEEQKNQTVFLSAVAQSKSGKMSSCQILQIQHDDKPPEIQHEQMINPSKRRFSKNQLMDLELKVVGASQMCVAVNGESCSWESFSELKTIVLTKTDAENSIKVRFRDDFNNESVYETTITHDATAPKAPQVQISLLQEPNELQLQLVADAADQMSVFESSDCSGAENWTAVQNQSNLTIGEDQESLTRSVKLKDEAGNESSCSVANFVRPPKKPTKPSLSLAQISPAVIVLGSQFELTGISLEDSALLEIKQDSKVLFSTRVGAGTENELCRIESPQKIICQIPKEQMTVTAPLPQVKVSIQDHQGQNSNELQFSLLPPGTGDWKKMSSNHGLTPRDLSTVVWVKNQLFVWGGRNLQGGAEGNGALYHAETDSWANLPSSSAPSARFQHCDAVGANRVFVWGGLSDGSATNSGAIYDPELSAWETVEEEQAPLPRKNHACVWNGSRFVVFGGEDRTGNLLNDGAEYDPTLKRWFALTPSRLGRAEHRLIFTDKGVLAVGGRVFTQSATTAPTTTPPTEIYRDRIWMPLPVPFPPVKNIFYQPGESKLVAWFGNGMGRQFRPVVGDVPTNLVRPRSGSGEELQSQGLLIEKFLLVFGGRERREQTVSAYKRTSLYELETQKWAEESTPPISGRFAHHMVWTGSSIIAFGGRSDENSEPLMDGAIYTHPSFPKEIAGGSNDLTECGVQESCYENSKAMELGRAKLKNGQVIKLSDAALASGFKVWVEETPVLEQPRILDASGFWETEDDWQKTLTGFGNKFSSDFLTNPGDLAGRFCADSKCFYFSGEIRDVSLTRGCRTITDVGILCLAPWREQLDYIGNHQVCSSKGMRLPQMSEVRGARGVNSPGIPAISGLWMATATAAPLDRLRVMMVYLKPDQQIFPSPVPMASTIAVRCVLPAQ